MRLLRLLTAILFIACSAQAQNSPVNYWTSHLPYNNVISIATDGRMLFAASEISFFTHDPVTGETEAYSKAEGMSDVDMAWVAHDKTTGYTILTYKNGNIDLFKNRNFYNIPDFKQRVINGTKDINNVFTENGLAYLSTSVGVIVVNIAKKEIKETYEFTQNDITIPIYTFSATNDHFYVTTGAGAYRISRSSPSPQVFSLWEKISNLVFFDAVAVQNIFFAVGPDSLYKMGDDSLTAFRDLNGVDHLDEGNGYLLVCSYTAMEAFGPLAFNKDFYNYNYTDTRQAVALADGSIWVADYNKGIAKSEENLTYIKPNGPATISSYDIYAYDRNILVAHGSVNDNWVFQFNNYGFSEYKDGNWEQYNGRNLPFLSDLFDCITITKDRTDGTIYAGSYVTGLFILKADGTHQQLKEGSQILESRDMNPGSWAVGGLVLDENRTLWLNNFGTWTNELASKTVDDVWYKYDPPHRVGYPGGGTNIIIDDIGQKWYVSPRGGGVVVYNDNGTIDDRTDDVTRQLLAGVGAGNLPDNDVYSIAKDKNNAIWIGTRAGIAIVNCSEVAANGECDAEQPIVQFDQFAGTLFGTEIVYAIAVDGANRKWVGTANGVWLLTSDGEQIVSRFTEENSPLPSNVIKKITIDPVTGDVYIGTEKGLVCYRGTATDGGETNEEELIAFPNPVPSGYNGTIAIKGFVENADVRITDISGQLVYRTTALGGQAVWNGLDYKGRRPQSGVYLVFATNRDGTEKTTGKIVFMQ